MVGIDSFGPSMALTLKGVAIATCESAVRADSPPKERAHPYEGHPWPSPSAPKGHKGQLKLFKFAPGEFVRGAVSYFESNTMFGYFVGLN